MTLHIFIIHSEGLTQRAIRLHGVIQNMRLAAQYAGFEVKPYFVLTPTAHDIGTDQATFQSKISYTPTGFADLDKTSKVVSLEILSNMQKHLKAWSMIADIKPSKQDLFMVIEDDVFILPDNIPNYIELLTMASTSDAWDFIVMGTTHKNDENDEAALHLQDTRELYSMIPCKEAYLITWETAKLMMGDFGTQIKFPMRGQLSLYMHTHPNVRFRNPSKQVTLDGSKLGLTPTTLHESNILVFNAEYMKLLAYMSNDPNELVKNIDDIRAIYHSIESLNSPDIMHLYGILLFRAGCIKDASNVLTSALECMQQQQGMLNSRTEIVNNFIDMCKDMQTDLPDLLSTTSKYLSLS